METLVPRLRLKAALFQVSPDNEKAAPVSEGRGGGLLLAPTVCLFVLQGSRLGKSAEVESDAGQNW